MHPRARLWQLDLQEAVSQGGFSTLLLLRLTPLPFAFSNLFLGSTPGVSAWDHAGATAMGFLRLALNSYLGTTVGRLAMGGAAAGGRVEAAVTIGGTLAAVAAVSTIGKRMLDRAASRESSVAAVTAAGSEPRAAEQPLASRRPRRACKSPKRLLAVS